MRKRAVAAAALLTAAALAPPSQAQTCQRPATPLTTIYLPNVTKTLGDADGWNTPFIVQNVSRTTATSLRIEFYRFSDGALVTTQNISLGLGVSRVIDPRDVAGLTDDTQYSVVVEGVGGTVGAIVMQLNFSGGDGAMTYEGFLR